MTITLPRKRGLLLGLALASLVLAVTAVGVAAGVGVRPAVAATRILGPLTTSGNQILDGHGQPVVLRGVGVSGLEVSATRPPLLSANTIAAMPGWGRNANGTGGINIVRIMLGEQFWNPDQCFTGWRAYQQTVKNVVNDVTSNGMIALVDLHWNTRVPCTDAADKADPQATNVKLAAHQQPMADADALTFWASVANTFKDNDLVAFDLYNEPHLWDTSVEGRAVPVPATTDDKSGTPDWTVWRDGGAVKSDDGVTWTAVGMQEMYETVRAAQANNLVFVDGNNWSDLSPPTSALLDGSNIVYAAHVYNPCLYSCVGVAPTLPGYLDQQWGSFSASQPTMITEFGWSVTSDGTFNQLLIKWAEAHNVGWIAYAWAPGHDSDSSLGLLANTATLAPESSGLPVRDGVGLNS
jgi:hypothetical protein